jgi:protein O-GlcNAc transferase
MLSLLLCLLVGGVNSSRDAVNYAERLMDQGQFGKAREQYLQALSGDPDDIYALQGVAICSINMGDVPNAIKYFKRALGVKPQPQLQYNLGHVYLQTGDFGQAYPYFRQCATVASSVQRDCYLKLAQLSRDKGDLNDVQRSLHRAIELDPSRPDAYMYLAETLNNLKQFRMAIETYDKALSIAPNEASIWVAKGDTHSNSKQPVEALRCFQEGQKLSAIRSPTYYEAVVGSFFASLELSSWKNWERSNSLILQQLNNYLGKAIVGPPLLSAYRLLFLDTPPHISVGISSVWSNKLVAQSSNVVKTVTESRQGRFASILRVAYMSRRFEDYPGTQMMVQLFERHNRSRVSIGALAGGVNDRSVYRTTIETNSDLFEDFSLMSIADAADVIKSHHFDVIIDYGKYSWSNLTHVTCACRWASRF